MNNLKDDIDFLEQTLLKVQSSNLHDQLEGYQMLKDQISHMRKRNITPAELDSEGKRTFPDKDIETIREWLCPIFF